ncbi:MAG: tetratricopeptide repeat protein [Gemmatimonadales bacterium]|jgi:TolB-like protein/tetratricopeptide (TPR) repeat protein
MSLPPAVRDVIAEFRRRRVFTVAIIYVAVAWLVLQIADLVVPGLLLPEWTYRFVLLLLILGFPVALVLAWAFEVTPDGVQRAAPMGSGAVAPATGPAAAGAWRRSIGGAVLLAVLTAAWWIGRERTSAGPSAEPAEAMAETSLVSVAVLPFVNMSDDSSQEFFSEGISEELLNLLAGISELRVISRTSSFAFKDRRLTAEQLGDTLHARYLVEGSVRRDDQNVRITAQVIDTETGAHVWSEAWDRDLQHIFAVQEEIAARVVDQLKISLLGQGPRIEATDPEAFVLVLQARHLTHEHSERSIEGAVDLYNRALAVDSSYAEAWSGLAQAYFTPAFFEARPFADPPALAREAAERALALDSAQGVARAVLGSLALSEGDLSEAAGHYERALALAPGNAWVITRVATFLRSLGRFHDAIRVARYAVDHDPVDWLGYSHLSGSYLSLGQPEEAVRAAQTARDLDPTAGGPHLLLCEALLAANRPRDALAAIEAEPLEPLRLFGLTRTYAALGQEEAADAALSALIDRHAAGWSYQIAVLQAYRGERDRAFDWLNRAVENEDAGLAELQPDFAPLRDDPRWSAFLERIGRTPERLAGVEFEVRLPRQLVVTD